MLSWVKSLFVKKAAEPRMIEHRGVKGYFSSEMIEEFDNAGVDYEKEFRSAVDEMIEDMEEEEDDENPYR
jgi:hypothetical protein